MAAITAIYDAAARAGLTKPVTFGGSTVQCVFRSPDETVLDGLALSREYLIEYPTSRLALAQGNTVVIDGASYKVREMRLIRDGSESRASLMKV